MCFTWFLCQFVFNKRFLKIYCISDHSFFLVSFTSMYTNIENYQQKVLRSEFNLDIFFHMLEPFFMKQPLTDRDEMSNRYRGPSIDASY